MIFHVLLTSRVPDNDIDYIDGKKVELLFALSKYEKTNKELKIFTRRNGSSVNCKLKKITFWCTVLHPVAVNIPVVFEFETSKNGLVTFNHDEIDDFLALE